MTREEAIQELEFILVGHPETSARGQAVLMAIEALKQPEQPTEVQDILQYLDEYLHPIVSPEHWSVYSKLYDMISMLPSTQLEQKKGKWIDMGAFCCACNQCWHTEQHHTNFCSKCGAKMEVEE